MPEENIGDRFEKSMEQISEVETFLDEIYENPKIATLSNKPVISMLITACEYLVINISQLRRGYLHETGE